jgi:hypothetical protein
MADKNEAYYYALIDAVARDRNRLDRWE